MSSSVQTPHCRKRDRLRSAFCGLFCYAAGPANDRDEAQKPDPAAKTQAFTVRIETLPATAPPVQSSAQKFLEEALKSLTTEQRIIIQQHQASHISEAVEGAYNEALRKKSACEANRWPGLDKLDTVILCLDRLKMIGDVVSDIDPVHIGLPWAGIRTLLSMAVADSEQMKALASGMEHALCIVNRLRAYFEYFQHLPLTLTTENLQNSLVVLYAHILRFLAQAFKIYSMKAGHRVLKAIWQESEISAFECQCAKLEQQTEFEAANCDRELSATQQVQARRWKSALARHLDSLRDGLQGVRSSLNNLEVDAALSRLTQAQNATHDSPSEDRLGACLAGTRVEMLSKITEWAKDPNGKPILWLCGMAGTGKSTISRSFAASLVQERQLGASFFFKRGATDRDNGNLLIPTIVAQLARRLTSMVQPIVEALRGEPRLSQKNMREQFHALLLQPLKSVRTDEIPLNGVVIVIDALDECEVADIQLFLELLKELPTSNGLKLRIFLTSRPELPIEIGFMQIDDELHNDIVLEKAQVLTIEADIRTYLMYKFADIRKTNLLRGRPLPDNWPTDTDIGALVEAAGPLFIYASTVCRYVAEGPPRKRLDAIIQGQQTVSSLHLRSDHSSHLRMLYIQILEQMIAGLDDTATDAKLTTFKKVIGPLIMLAMPLTGLQLAQILQADIEDVFDILDDLRSVINVPQDQSQPVQLLHLTFRDFLLENAQEDNAQFVVDAVEAHQQIGQGCVRLLSKPGALRRDMLDRKNPSKGHRSIIMEHFNSQVPKEIQYACTFFPAHLELGQVKLSDGCELHKLLETHLLCLAEIMLWIDIQPAKVLRAMQELLEDTGSAELEQLIDCFLSFFKVCERNSTIPHPLQLYQWALFLSVDRFSRVPSSGPPYIWQKFPNITTSTDHASMAPIPALRTSREDILRSPQRNVLAVTVPEGIIQLWDLDKGTLLQSLEGHSRAYRAVAFSPNGQLVGTTCLNNKLQLWEVSTGILKQSLGDAFPTHSDSATVSVAFSPNAEIVAVGSNNGIIEFWNVRSSCFVSQYTLETRHAITALAFSPDGQSIAFILGDHLEESDNPSQPMKTYAPRPTPLEFNEADYRNSSHKRLATHVLNINTFLRSHVFHTLPKEPPTPATETRLRFSPDGQDIVIATDIVRRWNLRDEEILQIIDCRPIELEFNTDGTHLQTEFGDFAIKNKSKMLYPEQGIVTSDLHINAWAGYVMCYKGRPLLNVPHEFRCGNMTIHGDKLAVRDHLGGIGLWKVNPEAITW